MSDLADAIMRVLNRQPRLQMLRAVVQSSPSAGLVSIDFGDGEAIDCRYAAGLSLTTGTAVVVLADGPDRFVAFIRAN